MVEKITLDYQVATQKRLNMLKKGKVADTWGGSFMANVSRSYDDIIREFEYFMREEKAMMAGKKKDMEKGGEGEWSEEKYYKKQMVKHARKIQMLYKEYKTASKKVDMAKSFYDVR